MSQICRWAPRLRASLAVLTVLSRVLRRLGSRDWVVWAALVVTAANGVLSLIRHDWPWTWVDPIVGVVYLAFVFALTSLVLTLVAEFVSGFRDDPQPEAPPPG